MAPPDPTVVVSPSFSLATTLNMETKHLQTLLAEAKALLDSYELTQTDTSRVEAQEKAAQLARALERPKDAILKLSFSVSHQHCLEIIGMSC